MTTTYRFSGHESFPCKSLWLKKGYDFVVGGGDFNSPEAVTGLGVGKNMVASIRYWLRVFGICDNEEVTPLGRYLFDERKGKDKPDCSCFHHRIPCKGKEDGIEAVHHSGNFAAEADIYQLQ